MPPRIAAALASPQIQSEPPPRSGRAVRMRRVGRLYVITSDDGQAGGVFVSRAAALRFAEQEFCLAQGCVLAEEFSDTDR
jgi:hypothetical protein